MFQARKKMFLKMFCTFRLPIDIYQTAKVSKLLLMIEKGSLPSELKGKSLSDMNLEDLKYPEEGKFDIDIRRVFTNFNILCFIDEDSEPSIHVTNECRNSGSAMELSEHQEKGMFINEFIYITNGKCSITCWQHTYTESADICYYFQ